MADIDRSVVLLAKNAESSRIVHHALRHEFGAVPVVVEQRQSRLYLMRRRIKKLGMFKVLGQIAFMASIMPLLKRTGRRRAQEIKEEHGLVDGPFEGEIHHVESVNSEEARSIIKALAPQVVVVVGTRIIGRKTLEVIRAPILNMHQGITPLYRGVHGGYWALVENRLDHVGTTVHFIDEGIDTGEVISQEIFEVTDKDTFATYPYLHLAAGIPILIQSIKNLRNGSLVLQKAPDIPSQLRTHPTLYQYVTFRLRQGVK